MKLQRETVKKAYLEFGERFGWPDRAKDDSIKKRIIDFDHEVLADMFNEEEFPKALLTAKKQARRFPCVADFYVGFNVPEKQEIDFSEYK